MSRNTKHKSGQSGNPKTQFKAGNRHRWKPGQSGNPSGIARRRREFEERFNAALREQGSPDEAARLLWEAARDREPWAVQALQKRLAPEAKQINVTHGLPAQQNQPAEQQETREAETSLKLYYYPARWERWTK